MAAVEVLQTLEYRGGQLNAAPVLEVENFTNWKKRFMCHIIGIEPQFENIISNGPFVPMAAVQRKPEAQWTTDERKAANLDQHLKSLIMSVLPDDQMNSVINCLTAKSTWDDLILYHEGTSDVKESRVMDLKLYCNTFKFKEAVQKQLTKLNATNVVRKVILQENASQRLQFLHISHLFQPKLLLSSENKPGMRNTKHFEAKYNKVKAKLALLSSSASAPSSFSSKNKGRIVESYDWDKEEVSSDDEETKVKALMALTDEERIFVGKESARNGEWTKITIKKEQRNNLSSKHRNLVQELNACKEQLLLWVKRPGSKLKKLDGAEPGSGPKTVKSNLKSKSTFKAETLKGITFNEPSSAPARGNKSSLASKSNSAPTCKFQNVKVEDDPPLAMAIKELNELNLQISKKKIISQRRGINPRNPQHVTKNCETCGSNVHTTYDHNDIEWFKKRETPHAKKAESLNALRSKTPTKRQASKQN
ncbi:hypothetical protein Tco_0860333 [Tanacetum coccineum]|uniref:Retrovirus-related Pol polyprotein from transposon TNT 1-94 n=1 Tax=Tanacetum coccineum TaxID=301880 RepID=A0ABQ5BI40_9ASTR